MRLLVTGSHGLIGRRLCRALEFAGFEIRRFDIRRSFIEDIRNSEALFDALQNVAGVIHLAAVSRVSVAEQDPSHCASVNESALAQMLALMPRCHTPPWLVFTSSKEVYGFQSQQPVNEDVVRRPINTYGLSKLKGEALILSARHTLPAANIVRLSNVYGDIEDHPERVVPNFARAAARGGTITICGADSRLDFVHVDDAVRGILSLIDLTRQCVTVEPIHLASGVGTTLNELAHLTVLHARQPVETVFTAANPHQIPEFIGDVGRAARILLWRCAIDIETGFRQLVQDFDARTIEDNRP